MLRAAIARLSRHTLTYAVAEQLGRLAGFLLLPLTTGYLSTADFGTREILATTLAVLAQLAGLNVTAAMSRFYFEEHAPERRRAVISTTVLSVAGVATLLAGVLALLSPWLSPLLPSDDGRMVRYLQISAGIFVFQIVREVQAKVLQTQERSTLFGVLSVSKLVTEISLQIFFLVKLEAGLEGLLWAVLLSELIFSCVLSVILLPTIGLHFSVPIFSALFAYSLPLVPNGVLQFCLHQADRYFVGGLASPQALGLYTLAYKLGYMPNYLILGPFLLIWYPFVFSIPDDAKRRELIARLTPYFLVLMTAAALVVALFAREIVGVVAGRDEFLPAWVAIPFVSFGYWLWGLFQVLQTGFYVVKETRPLPALTAAATIVNLFLNAVLIPCVGFVGAAVATTITFAVLCWVTDIRVATVYPVPHDWRRILGPCAGAMIGCVLLLLIAPRFVPIGWPLKVAFVVGWAAWCWWGAAVTKSDREAALDVLRTWRTRRVQQ